ncbi:hypothetical protein B0H19DRAFT_652268 [Mycena capillaripes]|nr:hypothetical protein B0H19DRAFT_652268 [Mycena capillaripes]
MRRTRAGSPPKTLPRTQSAPQRIQDDGSAHLCHRQRGDFETSLSCTGAWSVRLCCQGRTMISTFDWKTKDCVYNYQKLFDYVLDLFADANDRWAIETLDWFTSTCSFHLCTS